MAAAGAPVQRPFLTSLSRDRAGHVVVVLRGELDLATAGQLQDTLARVAETGGGDVVLDARRLSFCGAQGVAAIVSGSVLLARRDRRLTLRNPSPHLRRVLELVQLGDLVADEAPTD